MNDPKLKKLLRRSPSDAQSLADVLQVSQPTLSRRLQPLLRTGEVVKVGRARATRYALRRPVYGLPGMEPVPVYEIDENGEAHLRGRLTPIHPEGVVVDGEIIPLLKKMSGEVFSGLPYYLEYLRPEGFLGRTLCRKIAAESDLSDDGRHWNEDQLLQFLYRYGADLPGSLIVGRHSLENFLRSSYTEIKYHEIESEYHRLALSVLGGEAPGSSAGGEQPKFTAYSQIKKGESPVHVIVKFSPPDEDEPVAKRWRDLLTAEHRALNLLHDAGLTPNPVELLRVKDRLMLRIERYDRHGEKGRRPWISLGALDDEFFGLRDSIRGGLRRLLRAGLLSENQVRIGVIASLFGDFIGNTDQHFGNASLIWDKESLRMGPLYDILPMFYAPRAGGEIIKNQLHSMPVRLPEESEFFERARDLAIHYWEMIAKENEISKDFREIATKCASSITGSR